MKKTVVTKGTIELARRQALLALEEVYSGFMRTLKTPEKQREAKESYLRIKDYLESYA